MNQLKHKPKGKIIWNVHLATYYMTKNFRYSGNEIRYLMTKGAQIN